MGKIALASTVVERCQKPGCAAGPLDRHHKAHEALWFGPWAHREYEAPAARQRWRAFKQRYEEYRAEDTCLICRQHHAEIHMVYDYIIADDKARTGLSLYMYSWKQARILMERLSNACAEWLQKETPGVDSDYYEKSKVRRRAQLKRHAEERWPDAEYKQRLARLRAEKIRNRRPKPRS